MAADRKIIIRSSNNEPRYVIEDMGRDRLGIGRTSIVYKAKDVIDRGVNYGGEFIDNNSRYVLGNTDSAIKILTKDASPDVFRYAEDYASIDKKEKFREAMSNFMSHYSSVRSHVLVPKFIFDINYEGGICVAMDYMSGGDCGKLVDRINGFGDSDVEISAYKKKFDYPRLHPEIFNNPKWIAIAYTIMYQAMRALNNIHTINTKGGGKPYHGDVIPTNLTFSGIDTSNIGDQGRDLILTAEPSKIIVKLGDISPNVLLNRPDEVIVRANSLSTNVKLVATCLNDLLGEAGILDRNALRETSYSGYNPVLGFCDTTLPLPQVFDMISLGKCFIELLTGYLPLHFYKQSKNINTAVDLILDTTNGNEKSASTELQEVAKIVVALLNAGDSNNNIGYYLNLFKESLKSSNYYTLVNEDSDCPFVARPSHIFIYSFTEKSRKLDGILNGLPNKDEVIAYHTLLEHITLFKDYLNEANRKHLSSLSKCLKDKKDNYKKTEEFNCSIEAIVNNLNTLKQMLSEIDLKPLSENPLEISIGKLIEEYELLYKKEKQETGDKAIMSEKFEELRAKLMKFYDLCELEVKVKAACKKSFDNIGMKYNKEVLDLNGNLNTNGGIRSEQRAIDSYKILTYGSAPAPAPKVAQAPKPDAVPKVASAPASAPAPAPKPSKA
ncbi:MAG: hypothetical protein ABIG89_03680 [Candidatus Woesearchaeota archaeon]